MRRRLIALGLVGLALGLAAAYWFTQVPEKVAEEHRDGARPEHMKLAQEIDEVRFTLSPATFSEGDYAAANRAKSRSRYLRLYRRESRARARRLRVARRRIAEARETLAGLDREQLFEVDSRPLLGGTGPVEDAKAVARRERVFARDARAVLDDYEDVVAYGFAYRRLDDRLINAISRGTAALPNRTVFDPKQLTVPLDRLARGLRPFRRRYLRLKPPPELRPDTRAQAHAVTVIIQELRRTSAAFSRFDNAGAQQAQRRLQRRLRANSRRGRNSLARFANGSSVRRQFDALAVQDRKIRQAYDAL